MVTMVGEEAEKCPIIVPSDPFLTHNGLGEGGLYKDLWVEGGKRWRSKEASDSEARKGRRLSPGENLYRWAGFPRRQGLAP